MSTVKERKVVTVEMEAWEYAMLVDTLEMARQVRSKKFPTLNNMAQSLLDNLGSVSVPMGSLRRQLGPRPRRVADATS